jgi:hypothetical protein
MNSRLPRDDTFPLRPEQQVLCVQTLLHAMYNIEDISDAEGQLKKWRTCMGTRKAEVERMAWEILHKCAECQEFREPLFRGGAKDHFETFQDRFNAITDTLMTNKTLCLQVMSPDKLLPIIQRPSSAKKRVAANRRVNEKKKEKLDAAEAFVRQQTGSPVNEPTRRRRRGATLEGQAPESSFGSQALQQHTIAPTGQQNGSALTAFSDHIRRGFHHGNPHLSGPGYVAQLLCREQPTTYGTDASALHSTPYPNHYRAQVVGYAMPSAPYQYSHSSDPSYALGSRPATSLSISTSTYCVPPDTTYQQSHDSDSARAHCVSDSSYSTMSSVSSPLANSSPHIMDTQLFYTPMELDESFPPRVEVAPYPVESLRSALRSATQTSGFDTTTYSSHEMSQAQYDALLNTELCHTDSTWTSTPQHVDSPEPLRHSAPSRSSPSLPNRRPAANTRSPMTIDPSLIECSSPKSTSTVKQDRGKESKESSSKSTLKTSKTPGKSKVNDTSTKEQKRSRK